MKDRFKQLRTHFGLSQVQFAQRIQKSPGFIANVETGRSEVSDDTIREICSVFAIRFDWLKTGSGDMFLPGREVGEADKNKAGLRIKMVRKEHGLTQQQFADTIGYSKMQIHYVENGKTIPSNELLYRVSLEYGVAYEWLLSGTGDVKAEEAILDDALIEWLKTQPELVRELRMRSGLG